MSEKSGKAVSYYLVQVDNPNQGDQAYQAECGDIIEALGMTFNEGCAFKAIWRTAAARTLGRHKEGNHAIYDAEKVVFYAERMLSQLEFARAQKQVAEAAKPEWPNLDTVGPLFPAHHIVSADEIKADVGPLPQGVYLKIDDAGNVSGLVAVGSPEPSAAMKHAMNGGLTDSSCPYMCFPNNVCNKCGGKHDGKPYRGGREAV